MLHGIEACGVDRNELRVRAERRPRAGGEVLQPGADGQHEIRLGRQRVGRRRPGDPDRAHVQRVVPGEAALAGLRFAHGHAVSIDEGAQCFTGFAVQHAAARDDERLS